MWTKWGYLSRHNLKTDNHLPLLEEMFRFRALEYKCFQVTLMQIDLQRLSFFSPQEDEYYKEN